MRIDSTPATSAVVAATAARFGRVAAAEELPVAVERTVPMMSGLSTMM